MTYSQQENNRTLIVNFHGGIILGIATRQCDQIVDFHGGYKWLH